MLAQLHKSLQLQQTAPVLPLRSQTNVDMPHCVPPRSEPLACTQLGVSPPTLRGPNPGRHPIMHGHNDTLTVRCMKVEYKDILIQNTAKCIIRLTEPASGSQPTNAMLMVSDTNLVASSAFGGRCAVCSSCNLACGKAMVFARMPFCFSRTGPGLCRSATIF